MPQTIAGTEPDPHRARGDVRAAPLGKILVVDDQVNMRVTLAMMLRGAGYEVDEAEDGAQGKRSGAMGAYHLVVTDLKMGGCDGIELLRAVKEAQPMTEVIVMTAHGTIESAVEAMRLGAYDYIQKPFSEREIIVKVERALESRKLHGQVQLFAQDFKERFQLHNIVGRSQPIRDVLSRVLKIAPTDATVLITGESGTGKELVARAIHANSRRAQHAFVTVNCAAITETLLESELFGHARGAFTGAATARKGLFEEASGGTFFFDEIAETTPAFQAKLLRAVQEQEIRRIGENRPIKVDSRVIAATNIDLAVAVEERRFRQDLYYRLNVARFHLPPLRERREDIPLLVDFFLNAHTKKMNVRRRLDDGVLERLMQYDYPGNVRELANLLEQAVALSSGGTITLDDIPLGERQERPAAAGQTLEEIVDDAERRAVRAALKAHEGNRERAAEALNISPTTLWRKMTRLGITYESR